MVDELLALREVRRYPERFAGQQGPKGNDGKQGPPGRDGVGPDEKVKVDAKDPEAGFLADKLVAGPNTAIEKKDGKLVISSAGGTTVVRRGGSGTGSALSVSDEGSPLDAAVTSLDFTGAGVTATVVGHSVTVDIPAGSGTQDIEEVLTEGDDAGGQEVTNLGQVTINPTADFLYGLLIQSAVGFYDVYNAFIRVIDENGTQVFNIDQGGFDMMAPTGQAGVHVQFTEVDTSAAAGFSSRGIEIKNLAGGRMFSQSEADGLTIGPFEPTNPVGNGQLRFVYENTMGAPLLRIDAVDSNNDPFTLDIPLAPRQTYTESNVTTDRTYNANATSIDELADVLGTLIGDLRARGIVA